MPARSEQMAARFVDDVEFLLSNLHSENSGIKGAELWLAAGEYSINEVERGPKLFVTLGERLTFDAFVNGVSVTLEDPPRVLGALPSDVARGAVDFVERNRETLLAHWRGDLDSFDVIKRLVPV